MIRRLLGGCVALALLFLSSPANAADKWKLDWQYRSFIANGSCVNPFAELSGYPGMFKINGTSIDTFSRPGSQMNFNGSYTAEMRDAPFFNTLLKPNTNDIWFYGGAPLEASLFCAVIENEIWLTFPTGERRFVMESFRDGRLLQPFPNWPFDYWKQSVTLMLGSDESTTVPVGDAWAALRAAVEAAWAQAFADIPKFEASQAMLLHLEELNAALKALLAAGFDQLTPQALRALLEQYADVVP